MTSWWQYHLRSAERGTFDWWLIAALVPVLLASLLTMYSWTGDNSFVIHQFIWIVVSAAVFIGLSFVDMTFLRSTWVSVALFSVSTVLLGALFILGRVSHGAQSWFSFGSVSFQ